MALPVSTSGTAPSATESDRQLLRLPRAGRLQGRPAADQTVVNLVIVPLGTSGSVQLYNSSGTHLIVDVVGYFTDATTATTSTGLFVPVNPDRFTDTRGTTTAALGGAGHQFARQLPRLAALAGGRAATDRTNGGTR